MTNSGKIRGGQGGVGFAGFDERPAGAGGAAVSNAGAFGPLVNGGEIRGGAGGSGGRTGSFGGVGQGGAGGAGVANAATITSLSNSGTIAGGNGGSATGAGGRGGAGGAGIANSGTITTLTNSGTIEGGAGGAGAIRRGGGRRYLERRHARLDRADQPTAATIIGNVEIDNQANVTVRAEQERRSGAGRAGPSRSAMAA